MGSISQNLPQRGIKKGAVLMDLAEKIYLIEECAGNPYAISFKKIEV